MRKTIQELREGRGESRAQLAKALGVTTNDATTNAATTILNITHNTSGTAANGIAARLQFNAERANGTPDVGLAYIDGIMTDATAVNTALGFFTRTAAGALTEKVRIDNAGTLNIFGGGLVSQTSSDAAGFYTTGLFSDTTYGAVSTADRELRIQGGGKEMWPSVARTNHERRSAFTRRIHWLGNRRLEP